MVDTGCLTLLRLLDTAEFVFPLRTLSQPKPAVQEARIGKCVTHSKGQNRARPTA